MSSSAPAPAALAVSPLRFQIAMASVAVIFPVAMICAMLSGGVSVLQLICKDDGLPWDCSSKPQVKAFSEFNVINSLIGTIAMLLSNGVLGALADRWGRKKVLLIALFGTFLDYVLLALVLRPGGGVFRDNWRFFIPLATGTAGAFGGVFIVFFCLFAMVADFTRYRPETRASLFTLFEGSMGLGAIVGSQIAGYLLEAGPFYSYVACFSCILLAMLVVTVFLPDTTPPETLARKVNWKRANFVGAILIMIPSKSTELLRSEDAVQSYEDICKATLASHVGEDVHITSPIVRDNESGFAAADVDSDGSARAPDSILSRRNDEDGEDDGRTKVGSLSSPLFSPEIRDLPFDANHPLVAASPSAMRLVNAGLPLPKAPHAPGNALFLLAFSVALTAFGMIGFRAVYLAYLKQEYDISNHSLSNLSTFEYAARAVGSFATVPIFHKLVGTRLGELRTMQIMLFMMGAVYCIIPFTTSMWQIYVLFSLTTFLSAVPSGFVRGLISTEVGVLLQGKVLAAVTVMEILISIVAAPGFSAIFSLTNDSFIGVVHLLAGGTVIIASLAPLLINDSADAFNSRRRAVAKKSDAPAPDSGDSGLLAAAGGDSSTDAAKAGPSMAARTEGTYDPSAVGVSLDDLELFVPVSSGPATTGSSSNAVN